MIIYTACKIVCICVHVLTLGITSGPSGHKIKNPYHTTSSKYVLVNYNLCNFQNVYKAFCLKNTEIWQSL